MSVTGHNGRLGNHIIRNMAMSQIAEKNNLHVTYASYEKIKKLGIKLFVGKHKYRITKMINDYNYFNIFNAQLVN